MVAFPLWGHRRAVAEVTYLLVRTSGPGGAGRLRQNPLWGLQRALAGNSLSAFECVWVRWGGLNESTYGHRFPSKWLKTGLKRSAECCCTVASTGHSAAHVVVARLQVVTYVLYFGTAYFWLPLQFSAPGTQSPVLFALEPLTLR